MKEPNHQGRMSDETLKEKSGRASAEWFRILDKAGAGKWEHRQIAAYLRDKQKVSPWWSQMISVEYERARGIRQKFQKCDGRFSASASRTISVPLGKLFEAWADARLRRKWLAEADMEVTKTTKNKYFRAKWDGGKSRLSVGFYAKGPGKSQVAVDHERLADSKECARIKEYWSGALDRLQATLTS
jgi:hypothetical protein